MGALNAFSRAFSLVVGNKRIYLLVLVVLIVISFLSLSLFPQNKEIVEKKTFKNVLFEEYGTASRGTLIHEP